MPNPACYPDVKCCYGMKLACCADRCLLASLPAGKRGRQADRLPSSARDTGRKYVYACRLPRAARDPASPTHGPVNHDLASAIKDGITYSIGRWLPKWRPEPGWLDGQGPGSEDDHGGRRAAADGAGRLSSGTDGPPPPRPGQPGMRRRGRADPTPVRSRSSDRRVPMPLSSGKPWIRSSGTRSGRSRHPGRSRPGPGSSPKAIRRITSS